ncbi:MAG TPA: SIMPL domain-containing protein [Candidatus Paceibacterota bacterium]|nr:SIMPL domain-containing protein [Candidatus Paceibacterota bacterium]
MNGDQNSNDSQNYQRYGMRRRFWGALIFIVIIALIVFAFHHEGHYKGENIANLPTIAVSGHGEVFATSTVATFSFTASDRETTVTDAQNKMAVKANAAIDFLKKNGVDQKDIQTIDYSVNPTYADRSAIICPTGAYNCGGGTPTINGYEVSETITVKLRDPSKSGTILQGVGSAGVSNISGLSLSIDNPTSLQEAARKLAIDDAKAKAKQLAKDLDIDLDRIVSFQENGNNPGPIPYAKDMALSQAAGSAPVAPEIPVGQNKITSDVTITYEIR